MAIRLNCDMGESFGIWKMGNDEEVMPYIDMANLACGFHASDAVTMSRTVILAKKYNVIMCFPILDCPENTVLQFA